MPKCCSVYKCKATSENAPNRSFHLYPKDAKLRAAWMKRIRRENFEPSDYSYVCSYHFIDEDFKLPNKDAPPEYRKAIIKPGSIPAWNLRGDEIDERISHRNSRTSVKARTCTTNVRWNNMKESQTTEIQTSERVSCNKTTNLRQASYCEFNLADGHIKNDSFNDLSIQIEEATAAASNQCLNRHKRKQCAYRNNFSDLKICLLINSRATQL